MKKKIIITLLSIIAFVPCVHAGTFGSGGLLTIPTADILSQGELNLIYQSIGDSDMSFVSYALHEGVEVGGTVFWQNGVGEDEDTYPSLKVNISKEDGFYKPEVVLGVIDGEHYIVASKFLKEYGFRVHFGLADKDFVEDIVFLGVNKVLNPVTISTDDKNFNFPTTTLMLEYNDMINFGMRFQFDHGISADLGYHDFDELSFSLGFRNRF